MGDAAAVPSLVSFAVSEPGVERPEYSGVFSHLAILLLISRLDAPDWAKAAGYGWIALDVLTGVLSINEIDHDLAWPVRLGEHVLAGVWIATSSACMRHRVTGTVSIVTGLRLGSYSFMATTPQTPCSIPPRCSSSSGSP